MNRPGNAPPRPRRPHPGAARSNDPRLRLRISLDPRTDLLNDVARGGSGRAHTRALTRNNFVIPTASSEAASAKPENTMPKSLDELSVDTIRCLAMDAVQAANSGHPGTPMAMAP